MQQNDYTLKKEQIINEFDALIEFSNEHISKPALDNELIEALKKLTQKLINLKVSINEPFAIAVVGAQGVGKSTFINLLYNSLFDVGEIMPSTIYENEGIIIKIKKAPDETLLNKAMLFNEKFVPIETYDKEEFLELINLENSEKIRENSKFKNAPFIEYYPDIPGLEKFEIINTPGLNVLTGDFYPKVSKIFIEADLIVWVNSDTKLLDNFNKGLINRIHQDNKNIIGILSKIDDLYANDERSGIYDPIKQFILNIENHILLRENGKICLFPYDGYRSQIAKKLKSNVLLDEEDNIEDIEVDLEIIWNYFSIGFAYSNDIKIIEKLKDLNLINIKTEKPLPPESFPIEFDYNRMFNWLEKEGFIEKKDKKYVYTEYLGLPLLSNLSNFDAILQFSENYLDSHSLKDKVNNVIQKASNLFSDDLFFQLEKKYEDLINKKNIEYQNFCKEIENTKYQIEQTFNQKKEARIDTKTRYLTTLLINKIFKKIDTDIKKRDFIAEMFFSIPGIKYLRKESKIGNIMENIIRESFQELFNEQIEKIIDESQYFINYADFNIEQEVLVSKQNPKFSVNSQLPDLSKVLNNVIKFIKRESNQKLIKAKIIQLAKKDLRKKGNKKIKGLVRFFREIVKKVGIKIVKKEAKKKGKKEILKKIAKGANPIIFVLDLIDIGVSINNVLQECKNEIFKQIENQSGEFTGQVRISLEEIYQNILKEILSNFDKEINSKNPEIEELTVNLESTKKIIKEIKKTKEKIENIGGN